MKKNIYIYIFFYNTEPYKSIATAVFTFCIIEKQMKLAI